MQSKESKVEEGRIETLEDDFNSQVDENAVSIVDNDTNKIFASPLDSSLLEQINALVFKDDNKIWTCKACGKQSAKSCDIRKHSEIHIEGLSFQCPNCDKSFRTRVSLSSHKSRVVDGK